MADRKDERRTNIIVGLFVSVAVAMLGVSMFVIATSEGLLDSRIKVYADFRAVTGLTKGSPVQLAGKKVGTVGDIEFKNPQYPCDPATEDYGRPGEGRTDQCEASLFCAAEGLCGELEEFSGEPADYAPCSSTGDCAATREACVDRAFRVKHPRVRWLGPEGICVPYFVQHSRVSVTMEIQEDKLVYVRADSRATVSSNGPLGDKLVDITVGQGKPLEAGSRLQTTPSLMEELYYFKDRLDAIVNNVDRSLSGVAGLFDSLNDENTKRDLKGLLANANEISRQVAEGEGLVGALLRDQGTKADFSAMVRNVRTVTEDVRDVTGVVKREVGPALRGVSRASDQAAKLMESVQDPKNGSVAARVIHDQELGLAVRKTVDDASVTINAARGALTDIETLVAEVRNSIAKGEGTLGKLIKDPKAYDDLVKLLGNIDRNNAIKKAVRFVVEQDDASSAAAPTVKPDETP